MIQDYVNKLSSGKDLDYDESKSLISEIMSGRVEEIQIISVLTALNTKGESIDEITAFAEIMREKAAKIEPKINGLLTDNCSTGGAKLKVFNISTISAFVAAGAGVPMAKHGNRSNTSLSGSADLVESLGANLELEPKDVEKIIEKVGFGFLFAPKFHPAMKHAIGARRKMGVKTVFNILGPLTNPANVKAQVLGVFSEELLGLLTPVLKNLGVKNAMVVYGIDDLCEISTIGKTKVAEFRNNGDIKYYEISPEDFGIERANIQDIADVNPEESAKITKAIFQGEKGPKRDIILLNSAATIYVGEKAETLEQGIKIAEESIDSGKAHAKLKEYIAATRGKSAP